MKKIAKYYKFKETLLSRWDPSKEFFPVFSRLTDQNTWQIVDAKTILSNLASNLIYKKYWG